MSTTSPPTTAQPAHAPGPRPGAEQDTTTAPRRAGIPPALFGATAWSWRLLLLAGAVVALLALLRFFALVTLPVAGALLLSALLHPVTAWLRRRRWPRTAATAATLAVALALLAGVLWFAATQVLAGWPTLIEQASASTTRITTLAAKVPGASSIDLTGLQQRALGVLRAHYLILARDVMAAATTATEAATAVIITVFVTFFFLHQGETMFAFTVRLLPRGVQPSICGAGHRVWATLTGWVRGTVIIAIIHGVVIGTVLKLVGVPLALPLALVIVVASLLPVVGVVIGGLVSVGITFLSVGPLPALVVLLAVIVEDQIEAHLLEPFIVGRAVRLHPVVLVLCLTAGAVAGGLAGALLAVPTVAAANAALRYLTGVEDLHGHPREAVERTAPMEPPLFAPLPFLGIHPHVAAVRRGDGAAPGSSFAHSTATGAGTASTSDHARRATENDHR